jgi:diguanylate cyclase (GGDEF)-like protein/PAS domain S-box-containing protein
MDSLLDRTDVVVPDGSGDHVLRDAFATAPVGLAVIDVAGRFVRVNAALGQMLGCTPEELEGTDAAKLVVPDDMETGRTMTVALLAGEVDGFRREARYRRPDGTIGVGLAAVTLFDAGDEPQLLVQIIDITDLKRAEDALRDAEQKFRTAFDHAPIGMTLSDPDGLLLDVNRSFCVMVGRSRSQLIGTLARDLTHPDDRVLSQEADDRLRSGAVSHHEVEERYVHANGQPVWVRRSSAMVRGQDDEPHYCITQVQDVTEQRQAREELAYQALHDPLTRLPNRALFLDRLRGALARAGRRPSSVGVLFLDLDRFKVINDSLGHDAGDQLLVAMSERLQETLRPMDTAARFGGDEFVILCEDLDAEAEVLGIAERLCAAVAEPCLVGDAKVHITTSIGIALTDDSDNRPEDLVRDADAAMYRAKERGKNRYEVFDAAMRTRAVARLAIETALRRAVDRNELFLHYQPEVSLETGRVVGAEALVRWRHPDRGDLGPADFIGLADETGLIVPIGEWVLRQACADAAAWRADARAVWVNLAGRQLAQPDFLEMVMRVLEETGTPPEALHLEVTESVLMDDADATVTALHKLKDVGVGVGVDDFGTGYSSLARLKQFPVDAVKIDRSFVDGLGRDPEDSATVTAVVSMAHALGLTAMAEGVETEDQLAELRGLGCELGQGFLFRRPVPAGELTDAIAALEAAAS